VGTAAGLHRELLDAPRRTELTVVAGAPFRVPLARATSSLSGEALASPLPDGKEHYMSKLMYEQGNLFTRFTTGHPFGVKVVEEFGSFEIHGPFSSENEAWNYGMRLANESDGTQDFSIVKIETPHFRSIATAMEIQEHRKGEAL
jgi:hypothetical protein